MKPLTLFALFVALFLSAFAQAQSTIVFVDSQAAINAHPAGAEALTLQEQARTEIEGLQEQIQSIVGGAQSAQDLTAEQRSQLDTLQRSLESVQQRWATDIQAAAQPAVDAVNQAIAAVAQENGYTIVLNRAVAATSGLVAYADDSLDITDQVIARVQ